VVWSDRDLVAQVLLDGLGQLAFVDVEGSGGGCDDGVGEEDGVVGDAKNGQQIAPNTTS